MKTERTGTQTAEEAGSKPQECPDFGKVYDPNDKACAEECLRCAECQAAMAAAAKPTDGRKKKTPEEKEAEKQAKTAEREAKKQERAAAKTTGGAAAERYGYVHAAHEAILSRDMSRADLAKKMVELYAAHGKTGDPKQARRNLDSDLRSILVFGVVKEEGGKIVYLLER